MGAERDRPLPLYFPLLPRIGAPLGGGEPRGSGGGERNAAERGTNRAEPTAHRAPLGRQTEGGGRGQRVAMETAEPRELIGGERGEARRARGGGATRAAVEKAESRALIGGEGRGAKGARARGRGQARYCGGGREPRADWSGVGRGGKRGHAHRLRCEGRPPF